MCIIPSVWALTSEPPTRILKVFSQFFWLFFFLVLDSLIHSVCLWEVCNHQVPTDSLSSFSSSLVETFLLQSFFSKQKTPKCSQVKKSGRDLEKIIHLPLHSLFSACCFHLRTYSRIVPKTLYACIRINAVSYLN